MQGVARRLVPSRVRHGIRDVWMRGSHAARPFCGGTWRGATKRDVSRAWVHRPRVTGPLPPRSLRRAATARDTNAAHRAGATTTALAPGDVGESLRRGRQVRWGVQLRRQRAQARHLCAAFQSSVVRPCGLKPRPRTCRWRSSSAEQHRARTPPRRARAPASSPRPGGVTDRRRSRRTGSGHAQGSIRPMGSCASVLPARLGAAHRTGRTGRTLGPAKPLCVAEHNPRVGTEPQGTPYRRHR